MASKDQYFEYRFDKGLDLSVDPKQATGLLAVENGDISELGKLSKRKGLTPLDTYNTTTEDNVITLNEINGSTDQKYMKTSDMVAIDNIGGNLCLVGQRCSSDGVNYSEDINVLATYMDDVGTWKTRGPISSFQLETEKIISHNTYAFCDHAYIEDSAGKEYIGFVEGNNSNLYLSIKIKNGSYIKQKQELTAVGGSSIVSRARIFAIGTGAATAKFVVITYGGASNRITWIECDLATWAVAAYEPNTIACYSTGADYNEGQPFVGACKFEHSTKGECIAVVYASTLTDIRVSGFESDRTLIATVNDIFGAAGTVKNLGFDVCEFATSTGTTRIGVARLRLDDTGAPRHPVVSFRDLTEDVVAVNAAQTYDMGHPSAAHSYTYGNISICESPYNADSSGSLTIVASAIPLYEEVYQNDTLSATYGATECPHASKTRVFDFAADGTPALGLVDGSYLPFENFALASNLYSYNNKIYAVLHYNVRGHTEQETTLTAATRVSTSEKQPCMFLCSLARYTSNFSTYKYYWHPEVSIFPRQTTYTGMYKNLGAINLSDDDELSFIAMKQNNDSGSNMAFTPVITRVDMASSCANHQSAYVAGSKTYGGGVPSCFDGDYIAEANFLIAPQIAMLSSTDDAGSGILDDSVYRYQAILEVYNANGELERSYTSNDYTVDNHDFNGAAAANQSHVINITPCPFGSYHKLKNKNVIVKLFRTVRTAHGSGLTPDAPFYLVGTVAHDHFGRVMAITDTMSDATLIEKEVLYSDGGVLLNGNPPSLDMVIHHNGRLVGVNSFDRNELWYTKEKQVGLAFEWSDYLTMRVEDDYPITGLASTQGRLAILTKQNIYDVYGDGPNALGEGIFQKPSRISVGIGCNDSKTLKECELGFVFQSDNGIYLLGKDFGVNYISESVKDYELDAITSVQVLTDIKQIRFLQSARTLVWDYNKNKWSVYTGLYLGTSSSDHESTPAILKSTGFKRGLFLQNSSYCYDTTARDTVEYTFSVTTPWVSFAALQAQHRLHWLNILGDAISSVHGVRLDFYRDYVDTIYETHYLAGDDFAMPVRIPPKEQRLSSIKVKLSDYAVADDIAFGEVFNLSAIGYSHLPIGTTKIWKTGGSGVAEGSSHVSGLWACGDAKVIKIVNGSTTTYALAGEDHTTVWAPTMSQCWVAGDYVDKTRMLSKGVFSSTGLLGYYVDEISGEIGAPPGLYSCGYASGWGGHMDSSDQGTVWSFDHDTGTWSAIKIENNYAFTSIYSESGPNVWVGGVYHAAAGKHLFALEYYNGSTWADYRALLDAVTGYQHPLWTLFGDSDSGIFGIWKSPSGYIYCSGGMLFDDPGSGSYDAEPIIITNRSGTFTRQTTGQDAFNGRYIYFEKIHGVNDGNIFCIAQDDDLGEDTIWQFNGSTWTEIYTQATGGILISAADFLDLHATSTDLYVCGQGRSSGAIDNGIIIKFNYATRTWSIVVEDTGIWYYRALYVIE